MKRSLCAIALFLVLVPAAYAASKRANGKIVFQSVRDGNNEIYVMNQDGSSQTRLTFDTASDTQPSCSPDGTKIAFIKGVDVFVMNADGTGQVSLTHGVGTNSGPAWSPDGARIAFHRWVGLANFDIFVVNANGTNLVRLTTNAAADVTPSFSPDGQRIVFRSNRDGNDEIYVMNADGTGQTNLTNNPADDEDPSFSPDGTKILFTRRDPLDQIAMMNADGTGAVTLTSVARNFAPAFSPDGKKITFFSDRDGNNEIYTMRTDGLSQARLTNVTASDASPSWQVGFLSHTIGVYRPSTGEWLLRFTNTAGPASLTLTFGGQAGDQPVAGDWDGDGRTDVGIFRNGQFILGVLKFGSQCPHCLPVTTIQPFDQFNFGQSGDRPVAGDWDGDGLYEIGVFRNGAGGLPSTFLLRERQTPTTFITTTHEFGSNGDRPIAGDWEGDGRDTIGIFHDGVFLLTGDNSEATGNTFFGFAGDLPVAGDWNGTRSYDVGLFHPPTSTFSLETQLGFGPSINFTFGTSTDVPVAGHWPPVQ